jgi:putative membrane protein
MRRFNTEEFIKFIIFAAFTAFLYYLLKTGRINNFIHPKMLTYIKLTIVGLSILALFQLTKIFTVMTRNKFRISHLILFSTILIGFMAAPNSLNSAIAENKGVTLTNSNSNSPSSQHIKENIINNTILFNDDNYYEILFDVADKVDQYNGKKIIISGFVYKEEGFKQNEFVIARMMMSCCAADSQVIGLMCKWDKAPQLNKDQWVSIEGKIESTVYRNADMDKDDVMPVVVIEKIDNIKAPESPYVYP